MTIAYTTGQITLTNGSAVVTGIGTAWQVSLIAGGFIAAEADGNPLPIETVDSDTSITAAIEWRGASGTYDYALVRDTAYLQQLNVNSNTLARLIAELDAGTVFKYDASGDLAGRATYDERVKGFSYLVFIGVDEPALYVKASAMAGDWDGPFAYGTGPVGPMGPAGYTNPRGTYSVATAYFRNDAVLYNGSSFVALQATTGNAPPTLPATSNAYWQLTAIKGTDGTGTGDIVGPAGGVADGNVAVFDGVTGKLLKQQTKAQFKTWLSTTALDVSFDNSTANLPGAPATVQAAINAIGNSGGKNDALFAIQIADLLGQRMGMVGGVVDTFDDETGVLTKTNATYDAANDWYLPTVIDASPISGSLGTNFGNFTSNGGLASAFNGTTNKDTSAAAAAVSVATGYLGKTHTSAIGKVLTYGTNNAGYDAATGVQTITLTLYGKVGSAPVNETDGVVLGSISFSEVTNESAARTITSSDVTTVFDHRWVRMQTSGAAGTNLFFGQLVFYPPGTTNNMTLASVNYAASAVPSTARVAVQLADSLSLTPGTDFTMEVSRDGGTTWTAVPLTLTMPLFSGVKMYEGSVSVAGQPSGTAMKWRFKTLTGKNIIASGIVLQQS